MNGSSIRGRYPRVMAAVLAWLGSEAAFGVSGVGYSLDDMGWLVGYMGVGTSYVRFEFTPAHESLDDIALDFVVRYRLLASFREASDVPPRERVPGPEFAHPDGPSGVTP